MSLGDTSAADPSGNLSSRVVPRMQGDFVTATWQGSNTSGIEPIGKNVLVRMDTFVSKFGGGKLEFLDTQVERMNLGAESGTIYAVGDQAFVHNYDHTPNTGKKPVSGDRVYVEKYAGREIMGDDGVKYRLMDDRCVAGIYRGENALIQMETV
jgi:co-chaperonin GroES (HSP10)